MGVAAQIAQIARIARIVRIARIALTAQIHPDSRKKAKSPRAAD